VRATDVNALAEAMREWPQRVVDAGVKDAGGSAHRPQARNVSVLRHLDDRPGLLEDMRRVLDADGWDGSDTGSPGWSRIIEQAGPELTWEWLVVDPTTPWADLFTAEQRWKVAVAAAHTLRRQM
jgi:hypothetical protein